MKFSFIVPANYLEFSKPGQFDLILAQVAQKSESYLNYFKNRSKSRYLILDNGAFELGEAVDPDLLLYLLKELHPNEVVLPDVLYDTRETQVNHFLFYRKIFNEHIDVTCMGVVQGKTWEEWVGSFDWMMDKEWIDVIGIGQFVPYTRAKFIREKGKDDKIFDRVNALYYLGYIQRKIHKPIHALGCLDPVEIKYLASMMWVRSQDSKVPFIHGFNEDYFQENGLQGKKIESMDFLMPAGSLTIAKRAAIQHNYNLVNKWRCTK